MINSFHWCINWTLRFIFFYILY